MQLPEEFADCPVDLIYTYLHLGKLSYERLQPSPKSVLESQVSEPTSEQKHIKLTELPVHKGIQGEQQVQEILERTYLVKNVTRFSKTGDLIVKRKPNRGTRHPQKILVEVKNYQGMVPAKEVEKFYRDLQTNANFSAGVMISLHSDITGVRNVELQIARLDRDVPVMFVSSDHPDVILTTVEMMFAIISSKLWQDDVRARMQDTIGQVYEKLHELSEVLGSMSTSRNLLEETRNILNRNLQALYHKMYTHEYRLETMLRDIQLQIGQIESEPEHYSDNKICEPYARLEHAVHNLRLEFASSHLFVKCNTAEKIIADICRLLCSDAETVEIHMSAGSAYFWSVHDSHRTCVLHVKFMKTKTEILVKVTKKDSEQITIPVGFQYAAGWLTFSVTSDFVSGTLPKLLEFLKGML